jgi:membrane protease YdiL (CAAX protease family)
MLGTLQVLRAPWFPIPAPETPEQASWAQRRVWQRVGAAVAATLLLGVLIATVYPLRTLLVLDGVDMAHAGLLRGLLLQIPGGVAVLLIGRLLIGRLEVAGMQWRGAATSLVLSLPVLILALVELQPAASPAVSTILLALFAGVVTGCIEELYGRGVLLTVLGGARHMVLAVVLSSLLFAYLHMPAYTQLHGFGEALLRCAGSSAFAATFALIRLRSGSLVGPIMFHAINNAQMVFQAPRGDAPANHVSAGPLLVGCIVTALYWAACYRGIASSVRPPSAGLMSSAESSRPEQSPALGNT